MTEPNRLDVVVGGKYRIMRFLAAGGMGSVYEAQHTVVRRRFAVKFLHHELALRRELLTRFQREAEAAGALESEHVAAAVDFGIAADGAPYIVLEYLVGESLEHLLEREGCLPVERAANLVQQACRGVQAAHAAGIVHRDLKPHNLFVCRREDGTDLVKVLDFGVAKLEFTEQGGAATRTGTVLGTPSYMSPEQARGEKSIGHLSDVHALGAILYELLSGKKPHPGESHNAILHHIATQPPLPFAQTLPGLPEGLVAVVERALAGDPALRPVSADELAHALAPWAELKVWPAPKLEPSVPRHAEPSTTLLASDAPSASPLPRARQSPVRSRAEDAPSRSIPSLPAAPESATRPELEGERARRTTSERRLLVALGGLAVLALVIAWVALVRPNHTEEPKASAHADAPTPLHVSAPTPTAPTSSVGFVNIVATTPPVADSPAPAHATPLLKLVQPAPRPHSQRKLVPAPLPPASTKPAPAPPSGVAPVTFNQRNPYQ